MITLRLGSNNGRQVNSGSTINAHVLSNFFNSLLKRDKMLRKPRVFTINYNEFINGDLVIKPAIFLNVTFILSCANCDFRHSCPCTSI